MHHARMTILRERVAWRKERPTNATRRSSDLTPEEQANVRAALRFLQVRLGGWHELADAMRAKYQTVKGAARSNHGVSAGLALRAARVAGVAVEDVLAGRWPSPGTCPRCGRGPG